MLTLKRALVLAFALTSLNVQAISKPIKADLVKNARCKRDLTTDAAGEDFVNFRNRGPVNLNPKLTGAGAQKMNVFTSRLLTEIFKKSGDANVFITGPAMVGAATMLVNGATGPAREELVKALGYEEGELAKLNGQSSALFKHLNASSEGVTVTMANAFFTDDALPVIPVYKEMVQKRFGALAQNVPFATDPEAAAKFANDWASDNTQAMIKKILEPDSARDLAALLATAVYFKGDWETEFDVNQTYESGFTLSDGQMIGVETMHGTFDIEALRERDSRYLVARLPYAGRSASMYLILPNMDWSTGKPTITPDAALLSVMKAGELSLFKKGDPRVRLFEAEDVSLPKFTMKYSNSELKEVFEALGVEKIFASENLLALSTDKRLKVSYVRMDSGLEVTEKGSRAAGVASVGMVLESASMSHFEFNRPFAVVIRDEASGIDLFSGVIRNPTK